jgi:peptidyl-prolyl cis-trans isomerase SurA
MRCLRVGRVTCVWAFLIALKSFVGLCGAEETVRIAAVVNQHIISEADVNNRVKLAVISSGRQADAKALQNLRSQLIKIMIDEQLQLQLGEDFKLKIDDALIEAAMGDIESQNGMAPGGLKKLLETNHIPLSVIKSHLKASLIWREYIRERYKDVVQIPEGEVSRALLEMEGIKGTRRYLLGEILISSAAGSKEQALATARKLAEQLENGAQFTSLAEQFSHGASATRGGDIGWVSSKNLDKAIVEALNQLSVGDISPPIATERGYHILYLRDRLEPGEIGKTETYVTFKQVLLPHSPDAFEFEMRENFEKAQSLARNMTSCRVVEKLIQNTDAHVQTVNKVPVSGIPEELRQIFTKLDTQKPSMAVPSQEGGIIFILCAKETINPHVPTRDEIRENLVEEKLRLVAEREMRNRRRAAHIETRQKLDR